MYESRRELMDALEATPTTLAGLLSHVTEEQIRPVPGDPEWSIIDVVCHFRDAEQFMLQRMRDLLHQARPQIRGFDQEGWVRERSYATADLGEALDSFRAFRATHVDELASLTPAQWERAGQHDQVGKVTIFNHTVHVVWHDAVHLAQIARHLKR